MKKRAKNKFDFVVESLIENFSQIKNFEIINESENTRRIWNFLIQTILEFNSIKSLFVGIYIPETNKFIYNWKQEFAKSKYKYFVEINDDMWKYELNKLIRVGYVTLFHKYEGFAGNVFSLIDKNYLEFNDKTTSLEQFAKDKFNFRVNKEWYINDFIKRINWICNSEKHNDGFPSTTHAFFKQNKAENILHPESERIKISSDRLKLDIETMIEIVKVVFQIIMSIALYRMSEESTAEFDKSDDNFVKEQLERLNLMKDKIGQMINLTKGIQ
jgi:hypothetical protein